MGKSMLLVCENNNGRAREVYPAEMKLEEAKKQFCSGCKHNNVMDDTRCTVRTLAGHRILMRNVTATILEERKEEDEQL